MATEAVFVNMSSCILEIVEVHSNILVDLLVVLAVIAVLVGEVTWAAIGSWHG